jgi:hypothetical protein
MRKIPLGGKFRQHLHCSGSASSFTSNFKAHNPAKHSISHIVGHHLLLRVPNSETIPVNIGNRIYCHNKLIKLGRLF